MSTLRYTLAALLLSACCGLTAAPVPKPQPAKALTADMLVGNWHFEYGDWLDGVATFDAEGGYVAVCVPGSSRIYSGTWTVENGDTVVLSEYSHNLDTNARWGPTVYRFVFAARDYPNLVGKSNGTKHVAIKRAK